MNASLIFAGGAGSRMNSRAKPKQFLQFFGKELIIHTLENFQEHPEIDSIVVVCKEDWISFLEKLLLKYGIDKAKWIVPGGETGQASIFCGLLELEKHCPSDTVVLIHDGVRPFVDESLISECIKSVKEKGSAITVVPAIETIVTTDDGKITGITDRSKCFHAKAPQCFFLGDIISSHRKAINDGNTNMIDSASLMMTYGHELFTVEGRFDNIKITTPADFYTFKALYEVRENQQIFGL